MLFITFSLSPQKNDLKNQENSKIEYSLKIEVKINSLKII